VKQDSPLTIRKLTKEHKKKKSTSAILKQIHTDGTTEVNNNNKKVF